MSHSRDAITEEALLGQMEWVRVLARSLVADVNVAEDVSQQTLLAALENPPRAQQRGLRGWLATVLRNKVRAHYRSESRRTRREEQIATRESQELDDVVERAELHRHMVEGMLALREPYRRTLLLRFFEGLDSTEIARRESIEIATVRSRVRRGLSELRDLLDQRYKGRAGWCVAAFALAQPMPKAAKVSLSWGTWANVAAVLLVSMGVLLIGRGFQAADEGQVTTVASGADDARTSRAIKDSATPEDVFHVGGQARDALPPSDKATASVGSESALFGFDFPEQETVDVFGFVHCDGQPLEGVHVHLYVTGSAVPSFDSVLDRVETDGEGRFAFDGVEPDTYDLIARSNEYFASTLEGVQVFQSSREVEFSLLPAAAIEGLVLDPQGDPVFGARVEVVTHGGRGRLTDDEGHFRVSGLSHGFLPLRVTHDDWAPSEASWVQAPGGNIELRLRRFGVVSGTVHLTGDQDPHVVRVEARTANSGSFRGSLKDDASFRFDHIPPGELTLRALAPGHVGTEQVLVVGEGEHAQDIRLDLQESVSVRGAVVGADGERLTDVHVGFRLLNTERAVARAPLWGISTQKGLFQRAGFCVGDQVIVDFEAPNYVARELGPFEVERNDLDLGVIELRRGNIVWGRVVAEDGSGVQAELRFTSARGIAFTDAEGNFFMPPVNAGRHRLEAWGAGFLVSQTSEFTVTRDQDVECTVVLRRGGAIQGQVVGVDGVPIPNVTVSAPLLATRFSDRKVMTETDPDGYFELNGIQGRTCELHFRADGYVDASRDGVPDGASSVRFVLKRRGSLTGTVRSQTTGSPVVGFVVTAERAGKLLRPETRFVSPDGSYVLEDLDPGHYRVQIGAEGYVAVDTSVQIPAGDVAEWNVMLEPRANGKRSR